MSEDTNDLENLNDIPPNAPTPQMQSMIVTRMADPTSALMQLINLNDQDVLHEPTCLLCSNGVREEAEAKWLSSGQKHKEVRELVEQKSNITISNDIIDNHMKYHVSSGVRELQKKEYADKLQRLSSVQLTTLDRISLCFSALIERLSGINSIVPDSEKSPADIEKIKSSETARLMNSFNQLLKLQASILGEMKSSGELITLPRQAFVSIFNEAILDTNNDEIKASIKNILKQLLELNKVSQ